MTRALKGAKISSRDAQALSKLNAKDLRAIKSIQGKLGDVGGAEMVDVGMIIW